MSPRSPSIPPESVSLCPGCGQAVDVLRAGHVAILEGRFRYFCDAACKERYLAGAGSFDAATATPPPVSVTDRAPPVSVRRPAPSFPEPRLEIEQTPLLPPVALDDDEQPEPSRRMLPAVVEARTPSPAAVEAIARPDEAPVEAARPAVAPAFPEPEEDAPPASTAAPDEDVDEGPPSVRESGVDPRRAAMIGALVIGLASVAIPLGGDGAAIARLPLAVLAALVFVGVRVARRREPSESHWGYLVWPHLLAVVAAGWAAAARDPHAGRLAALVGLAAAAHAAAAVVVDRALDKSERQRRALVAALGGSARLLRANGTTETLLADEVKAGEQVLLDAGETSAVDGMIAAGEAEVVPHPFARQAVKKREGDALVAGAKVVRGSIKVTVTFAGVDRGLMRAARSLPHRADVASQIVVFARLALERGVPGLAACVGVAVFAQNGSLRDVLGAAAAAAVAASAGGVLGALAYAMGRAQLGTIEKGVLYKDVAAFDAAGRADVAVLCSRGTLLLGEPEVVAVETLGALDRDRVLSLAAGAETASTHPFATAILRTVRAQGLAVEPVRSAHAHTGLGVTALGATGERIVVGSRALLLQEKISVAVAESRIEGLEAQGRSVLLVALGGKLVGVLALQDGLRVGARAAVEHLASARVEPVLLSGESRETCETIARALDIDHVRPEVLPLERGAEVRALAEGGREVAVIGHAQSDDGALGAADVSVALGAAGAAPGEWAASTVVDDVRAGVLALTHARRARDLSRRVLVLGLAPGAVATLGMVFGILPVSVAPLATVIAILAAFAGVREPDPSG